MPINNTTGILSSAEQAQANYEKYKDKYVDATSELVNSETFMQLLVAEMTNQDPLEPTSNTEFISQLATFSQMQYARDSSKYSMANYAASLVGKTATASRMEGKNLITKTGVVESVTRNESKNSYTVKIDGESFDLSKITAVKDTEKSEADSQDAILNTQNALGDSIARASGMIGMYATINKVENEVTTKDEGFIAAIRVQDGVISAVINDKVYALADISEVTYATIVNEPENGEQNGTQTAPENTEQTVIENNEEEAALQMGAIIPDYSEEDLPDLVDEDEDLINAVKGIEG